MNNIIKFIESNLLVFSSLVDSEVLELECDCVSSNIVDYLKLNYRFDYKNICVYYSDNKICVENCCD